MSDLRSQLIAKLGVEAPKSDVKASGGEPDDPLAQGAHLSSDWVQALRPAARAGGVKLNPNPSMGAVCQAHDVLVKQLKGQGRKRERAELEDLRGRYMKKREKVAWSRLKTRLEAAGVSSKLYRAIKQGQLGPEVVLGRWNRIANKGLNTALIRAELLGN